MEIDAEPILSSENNVDLVDETENKEPRSDLNDNCAYKDEQISRKTRKYAIESDSEDEESSIEQKNENSTSKNSTKTRKYVLDSDSENEEPVSSHDKSFTAEDNFIYNINSKGDLVPETSSNPLKSILSSLCDPETSSDEDERPQNKTETELEKSTPQHPIKYKKSSAKHAEQQPKKMTVQEAAKQRTEIQSESQRMTRESNISLPYHKPKSYTIKEFLAKRSKLATPKIPKAPISLKMSKDQLIEISKTVDERIKQVEEFFKSDDSEDEEVEESPREIVTDFLDALLGNVMKSVEEKKSSEEIIENNSEPMEVSYNLEGSDDDDETIEQEAEIIRKKTVQELLKEQLLTIQPKLSGGPDELIDLDKGVTRPNEVKKLVDKFFQHSLKRAPLTQETNLKIMEVTSGGQIVEEEIKTTKIEDEEDKRAMNEIPGAKINKLRFELKHQIAQKRAELWKQKQEQGECVITSNTEKKLEGEDNVSEFGENYDFLDNEDEEEFTEDDEEEDYEIKETKSKPKSAFIDEEAEESEAEEEIDDETESNDEIPEKKALKRIIQPAEDDSDSDQEPEPSTNSGIPPNVHKTPQKPQTKSNFDFLTPVSYLTGLQNTNSAAKSLRDSPNVSPFALPAEPSPFKELNWQKSLQKKLFTDSTSELSQPSVKDLAEICSGTFPETQIDRPVGESEEVSIQDLADICTGAFPSASASASQIVEITQTEIKNLNHNDDQLISQLLDEEELERFKKKFIDSPTTTVPEKNNTDATEVNATGLINSDDENDELEVRTTKRKQKKLVFSDDEDEEETEAQESSESETEEKNPEDVEYDSEENEIIAAAIEKKQKFNIGEFFEEEAELSESEWGSEDEDERGMDNFEVEEGDKEKYDENQVRRDLERIHMRQVLDEDQRDVKLLQELLLEDGELHGSGRQRQFRWKNIDSLTDENQATVAEEESYFDEDDNEQNFRIMRLKRETFLQKQQSNRAEQDDIDSVLGESSILKFGQDVVKKSQTVCNNSQQKSDAETTVTVKQSFSLASKSRGSFLGRSDDVLERLAKITNTYNGPGAKTNSQGFVFKPLTRIGADGTEISNKRKAKGAGNTPNAIKKIRLDNFSPASGTSKNLKGAGLPKKNVYTKLF